MDEPTDLQTRCETHGLNACATCVPDSTPFHTPNDETKDSRELDAGTEAKAKPGSNRHKPVCAVCLKEAGKTCSICKQIRYCSVEHQRMDWINHKKECTSAGIMHSSLLFVNFGDMREWIDEAYDDFFILVKGLRRLSRAADLSTAMETLTSPTCPGYVIVGDRVEPGSALVDALVQHVQNGGTVAFGMGFPRFTKATEINQIFTQFGLSWKAGVKKRARFTYFNRDEPTRNDKRAKKELQNRSVNPLPNLLHMAGFLLKEVPSDQAIYLEMKEGGPGLSGQLLETPVAFAPVGQGWVGYIGDMGWEGLEGYTEFVMRAMIGLRIHPMPKLPFLADALGGMFSQSSGLGGGRYL